MSGNNNLILRRREEEDLRRNYAIQAKADQRLHHIERWERKTQRMIEKNQIQNIALALKAEDEAKLHHRRQRLAALLAHDDAVYRAELDSLKETSTQKASRMVSHARRLKQEREARRQAFAQEQYARQWRLGCDELRTIDSDRFAAHCHQEVGLQRLDRAARRAMEKAEEEAWANKWEQDRQQKATRELEESKLRTASLYENKMALLAQMEDTRRRREDELNQQAREREAFQKQMSEEARLARENQARELEMKRLRQKQVVQFNQDALERRQTALARQREEERRIIREKMEQFRKENEKKDEDKKQYGRDIAAYKQFLKDQADEQARVEAEMERLIAEDLAKANSKRDMQWERERIAREKLMKDVYQGRALQIEEKKMLNARRAHELAVEKAAVEKEIIKAQQLEEQEEREERERARQMAADLKAQIMANKMRSDAKRNQVFQERHFSDQAELQYRAFLENEKRRAQQAVYKPRSYGIKNAFTNFHNSAHVGNLSQTAKQYDPNVNDPNNGGPTGAMGGPPVAGGYGGGY